MGAAVGGHLDDAGGARPLAVVARRRERLVVVDDAQVDGVLVALRRRRQRQSLRVREKRLDELDELLAGPGRLGANVNIIDCAPSRRISQSSQTVVRDAVDDLNLVGIKSILVIVC